MKINIGIVNPKDFLFDITEYAGSSDKVCLMAIEHYNKFINHPDSVIRQIANAMVGNLTEYYNITSTNEDNQNLNSALLHLSDIYNFMNSKNELIMNSENENGIENINGKEIMDVESIARIKSFCSFYEKLLGECMNKLQKLKQSKEVEFPTSGLAKDIIATRDILHPRNELKENPQEFYKYTYQVILDYMEYIDNLSKDDSHYSLVEIDEKKQNSLAKPKKFNWNQEENIVIPTQDFIGYALEIKNVPKAFRHLVSLTPELAYDNIASNISLIQSMPNDSEEIDNLPLTIALKNQIEKETFIEIRNSLEQEAIDHMDNKTFEAYLELLENSQDNLDKKFENSLSKLSLNSNKYKAYLKIVRHMDKSIEDKNYNLPVEEELTPKFSEKFEKLKKDKLDNRLKDIRELNLNDFEENYNMAKKIRRYSLCSKDYMKNPKSSGYQSFHINVKTPWGYYEKQIRTANQDNHAEHGSASHDEAYKPYEKDKSFHRLKLPIPLVPARDENREIIFPVTLEIACFEDAVKLYYHQNFEYFSEGKSYKELVSTFSRDKFDEYLHNISNPQNNQNKMFTRVLKKFMEFMDLFNHGSNQR